MTQLQPSPALLSFVRSRIPMLEHDLHGLIHGTPARDDVIACGRRFAGGYSLKQAFFYQAEWFVDLTPRVSEKALAYAHANWGDRAAEIWGLRRTDIVKLEGRAISQSGLIYEHIFTGGMCQAALERMFKARGGTLDVWEVAVMLQENYATAWVTREEDKLLPRSDRGKTLADALEVYEGLLVQFAQSPAPAPSPAKVLQEEEREVTGPEVAENPEASPIDAFFARCRELLKASHIDLPVRHSAGKKYANMLSMQPARGLPALYIELRGRGAVQDVFLDCELVTEQPFVAPDSHGWRELRERLGEGWEVSFGRYDRVEGALCRIRRQVADGFHTRHATEAEVELAAQTTAAAIEGLAYSWGR